MPAMFFETAGITVPLWLPLVVGFVLAFFGAMVGISGAFLLVPFQMSVLGYVTPSVSATNLVYNLVAIPSGVWRFIREGRMLWPLAGVIAVGTLPGLLIGWWLRVYWIQDPRGFKLFVGLVLAYLALRLLTDLRAGGNKPKPAGRLVPLAFTTRSAAFEFSGQRYSFDPLRVLLLAMAVGAIGGTYGVGGGAIIAPFLIAMFGLPVHAVAGAALFAALITSVFGVALYAWLPAPAGVVSQPDWALGMLFGAGGAVGMYFGARVQKHVPQRALRIGLGLAMTGLAAGYVIQFFV
jgi:uncharacterized protein